MERKNLFIDFKNIPRKELYKIRDKIDSLLKEESRIRLKQQVALNDFYIGKCYKSKVTDGVFREHWRYYKVISGRANNEYKVSVLSFPEEPLYWFKYNNSKNSSYDDYYEGSFDFYGIETYDIMISDLGKMVEININDFNCSLQLFMEKLKRMKFEPNHNRGYDMLPSDDGWERKEKEK